MLNFYLKMLNDFIKLFHPFFYTSKPDPNEKKNIFSYIPSQNGFKIRTKYAMD